MIYWMCFKGKGNGLHIINAISQKKQKLIFKKNNRLTSIKNMLLRIDTCHKVALLLPYKYNSARRLAQKGKLYYDLPRMISKLKSIKSHCVIFETEWTNPNCVDPLQEPHRMACVECDPRAQLNHKKELIYQASRQRIMAERIHEQNAQSDWPIQISGTVFKSSKSIVISSFFYLCDL
ncbi:conserved hypothetical protein [Trichinella spiralis]|uniref:hypothetical protein n=1 Tax=Trichinella spiralis TaxID=6334 RepID=UPI0001EFE417|nr:conserved hypothetical protein [Trichinella spiralis]